MPEQTNPEENIEILRASTLFKVELLKRRGALCGELNTKFANIGFDNSNTFKSLSSKIKRLESGDVEKQLKLAHQVVDKQLNDHIQFTNKRVYFYSLSAVDLNKVLTLLQKPNEYFILGETNTSFNYEELTHDSIETSLILGDDDFKVIYLKSARNRRENVRIQDEIPKIKTVENEEIIDLIKVIQYSMNAYDFIALDFKNEHLILGADLNGIFPRQETEKAIDKIQIAIRKLAKLSDLQKNNLRNCVENLENEEGGDVLDHAFITADGGYNHAGKSLTSGQDVRKDNFHSDGIKGKEADYYGIVKAYSLQNEEKVIISIKMTFRDYKKVNVPIRFAILDGIQTFDGLKFSIRKVIQHNHN
jgi:hypothetical protein